MAGDVLIIAIGQVTSIEDESLGMRGKTTIEVGKAFETDVPGVFAAGDCVSGPATVVQAVAQGNRVALVVDAWLTSGEMDSVPYHPKVHDIPQLFTMEDYADARRPASKELSTEERLASGGFVEVEMEFDERTAQEEAKRCLRCDLEWLERIGEPIP